MVPGAAPAATIYVDADGQLYFRPPPAKAQPTVAPSPVASIPSTLLPVQLFRVPDAETASVLNPLGAAIGKLVSAPAASAPATLADATDASLRFDAGAAFPSLHYGQLLSHGGRYYVVELRGKTLVPDAAVLAAKGYQATEALAVADPFFAFIPGDFQYLPAGTAVVRGDRRPDVFLYTVDSVAVGQADRVEVQPIAVPPARVQKQLLVGPDTLAYYTQRYSACVTVAQADIDAVPVGAPSSLEVFLVKQLGVTRIECQNHAHRTGGDKVEVMVCVDDAAAMRPPGQAPNDAFTSKYTTVWQSSMDSKQSATISSTTTFYGAVAVAIVVDSETYPVGQTHTSDTKGWLDCEGAQFFCEAAAGGGDQVLSFTAMTQAFDIGPVATGHDWKVAYDLTVRVDYAKDAGGKYIPLTASQLANLPNNILKVSHFFVLMMENRSFDHLLGANEAFLSPGDKLSLATTPPPSGVYPGPFTPMHSGTGPAYDHSFQDALVFNDPNHEIDQVMFQLTGKSKGVLDSKGEVSGALTMSPADFVTSFTNEVIGDDKKTDCGKPPVPPVAFDSVLGCMSSDQAYAVNALADNFQVCNRWFASMPGPTWPNRFFLHCGTSGGISVSPDEISPGVVNYMTGDGFQFDNGSIFDRLTTLGVPWRVYHSGGAQVWSLQGMSPLWNCKTELPLLAPVLVGILAALEQMMAKAPVGLDVTSAAITTTMGVAFNLIDDDAAVFLFGPLAWIELAREITWLVDHLLVYLGTADQTTGTGLQRDFDSHFASDVSDASYLPFYTFIEPRSTNSSFGDPPPPADGIGKVNSGHPGDGIQRLSEDYIAEVYGALSRTPMWQSGRCALVLAYDEHGGIYDHVPPPTSPDYDPGEQAQSPGSGYRSINAPDYESFKFTTLGVRVPAVVISPYHQKAPAGPAPGLDTRIYDHASIVRTLQRRLSDSSYLSARVQKVNDLFDAFGNVPLVETPPPPTISAPVDEPGKEAAPATSRSADPIPTQSSPNYPYHLDRAAEILYRCNLSSDDTLLSSAVTAAAAQTTGAARAAAVESVLAARLQDEKTKRAALKTMGDAAAYLGRADAALEAYRARLAAARSNYLAAWTGTSPKAMYEAIRAGQPKAPF